MLLAAAAIFSERLRAVNIRTVVTALALQVGLAAFALIAPVGQTVLSAMAEGVNQVIGFANEGITFLFGPIADPSIGFVLAVQVLPVIIFVSSLVSVLYYLRIMPLIVAAFGGLLRLITGVTRMEAVCAVASIFIGMIEAPLTIKPYLAKLTRAQLFTCMTVGLATVSGAILVGYARLGIQLDYLLAAAFMSAPGGIVMAKLLVPETETPFEPNPKEMQSIAQADSNAANVIEAAGNGAAAGLQVTLNVVALLLAFVALMALGNGLVGALGGLFGFPDLSLELILGWIFAPITFLIGVPWEEAVTAGGYIGQKTILNEFYAYANFAEVQDDLSPKTVAIVTFALCGFANLAALAVVLGGLGSVVPERKSEIAQLGLKAILGSTLSNLMSAAIAASLLSLTPAFA